MNAVVKMMVTFPALLCAAGAWAGSPINESRPLRADGRVSVDNLAGEIEVRGWDQDRVVITGELGEDVEELEISGDADSLRILVRYPRRSSGIEETLLQLRVPVGASLQLEGVSADLRVDGVSGPLQGNTVSGDIEVDVRSPEVSLQSVSGDIRLRAPAASVKLQSVSGDVRAEGVQGDVSGETVSGDVDIKGGAFRALATQTVSGDLNLQGALAAGGSLRAESMSGDIDVLLAEPPDALLTMKSFSGVISSEFGPREAGGRRKIEKTLGSGKGRIDLNSFSGDIRLAKR
ncbi:MAG: DUF4097 family beta strand repeat-containing protein [Nevskiales bacterium]|nr:DUF4097 family beta strand repeat-containing protein [Nevskiales bacterium]